MSFLRRPGSIDRRLPANPVPVLGLAPRRNLLTKTMGHGAEVASPIQIGLPITFLVAIPIEAQCYAARLGFVNIFNFPVVITSAWIYSSDSYSVCAEMTADESGGPWRPVPTGAAATGTRVTFDCGGSPYPPAGTQMVNSGGTRFSYTMPADPTNASNASRPVTLQWSDLVPITSIPQAASPEGPHILFIYITIGSPNMVKHAANWFRMATDPQVTSRRQYYGAIAWDKSDDKTSNPIGTAFRRYPELPQFVLQYLTPSCGVQCVTAGDSLTASPSNDWFSTPVWRAAADLSTQALPIEVASVAFSGANSSIYHVSLQNNAAAIRPSVLFCQPLSRNDGLTTAHFQTLLARTLAQSHELHSRYGTRLILNSPGCAPDLDGHPPGIAAFTDMLARLRVIAADGTIPHIDGPSVLGWPDAPWNHISGVSDDGTHPSSAGAELLVAMTKQAMRSVIGI